METVEEEAAENESCDTVSTLAEVTMNEEIEVGFLRAEKNYLITKLSCAEQQVSFILYYFILLYFVLTIILQNSFAIIYTYIAQIYITS